MIDSVWRDISIPEETPKRKWKWFCSITEFKVFAQPVPWMESGSTLEPISRNLFGNGIRRISDELFDGILSRADIKLDLDPSSANKVGVSRRDEDRIFDFLKASQTALRTERTQAAVLRIRRDTPLVRMIKELYENKCQICGEALILPGGRLYSEGHHIKPLGQPHNGPDSADNLLVLCPNHHVLCDFGAIRLDPATLRVHPLHKVEMEYIRYHNEVIWGAAGNR